MAYRDPIEDGTPNKRRRLDDQGGRRGSEDEYGDDFTLEDVHETQATLPLEGRKELQYSKEQFHNDLNARSSVPASSTLRSSPLPSAAHAHVTQPTQRLPHATQPTQMLKRPSPSASDDVQVERSSPMSSSTFPAPSTQTQTQTQPTQRAPTNSRGSLLASAMAPPGTNFRPPQMQNRSAPIDIDSESDEDPPVHNSDNETQGLTSNLKPTQFKKGGRGLDSTPNRGDRTNNAVVRESPKGPSKPSAFSGLLAQFSHVPSSQSGGDMASAYGGPARPRPRPQAPSTGVMANGKPDFSNIKDPDQIKDHMMRTKLKSLQKDNPRAPLRECFRVLDELHFDLQKAKNWMRVYENVEDIPDGQRNKVHNIQAILPATSNQRCVQALIKKNDNLDDAVEWLTAEQEKDAPREDISMDELAAGTPVAKRGVAVKKTAPAQPNRPVAPAAKQQVKQPTMTIAEKYGASQAARKMSQQAIEVVAVDDDEEEDLSPAKPRKRLQQGRKPARSPTPASSPPPQPAARPKVREAVVIDDDSGSESEDQEMEEPVVENKHAHRLLKFFNECSATELEDLSAQPEEVVKFVLEQRPFESLDAIRAITKAPPTKAGKSKARPVGDKMVDVCGEVWTGYDAVDELVEKCEDIAKPIQEALKGWGVGAGEDGELGLMNLDIAHDSGIGTPASSADDTPVKKKSSGKFLGQPESMNSEAVLKNYQLVGLNWLQLMWSTGNSCILADDMGLGKTCQVISFLAHLQEKKVDGVHLVIVPGSTLENWLREFEYFAPQLSVQPYYGSQAARQELQQTIENDFDTIDVIVTTYEMTKKPNDNKFLRKNVDPLVCIYDEAHSLRNPQSDRYTQLMRIPATFKILLTGTPLQNNLQELVAILAFIMPDLFREKIQDLQYIFQHKASTKNADHAAFLSAQRIARARSMMTPFILRRKKEQVLDLPAKHSRVEYCDMTPSQSDYYNSLLADAQEFFAAKHAPKSAGAKKPPTRGSSQMLMALRQAAIHPLLKRSLYTDKKIDKMVTELRKNPEFADNPADRVRDFLTGDHHQALKGGDFGLHRFCYERPYLRRFELKSAQWMDAGKIAKFSELIQAFVANGDRTLVFSQFTSMMDILEQVLETLNVKFLRLDGSTDMQIRQDMLDNFAADASIPVFMLSTRAGGAGINLAAANKVVIFDSGFNPQDDIQAENRAHRVGQTREVEVVRLVTRGTIEEQIHALGESKLALDERVAGQEEGGGAKAEKAGEAAVEEMFLKRMKKEEGGEAKGEEKGKGTGKGKGASNGDLRDMFKDGMEGAGVKVKSKQAAF